MSRIHFVLCDQHIEQRTNCAPLDLASASYSEAMSESPPAQEEKDDSPKSFEFLPPRDPAAKCGLPFANSLRLCSLISALWVELWFLNDSNTCMALAADGDSASTPKLQRPPPPPPPTSIKVAPAISTCARSSLKTEARTPKTQGLCKAGPMGSSMSVKRSVVK